MADLLIRGGSIVDGSGAAAFDADVRVSGRTIVEIGPDLSAARGRRAHDRSARCDRRARLHRHPHASRPDALLGSAL